MTDRRCLSTAREGYIGASFGTRSIEEIRAIFGKVRKLHLPIDKVYKFADIGKAFEHNRTS
ncbi:hypothetical protein [Bradyrhizobium elkanii]|uniref:hypothetical protein n=1 Tax=Bradyrhizobium elkanii TaxID=29448 RepID=UPI0008415048|nr:NADPH2:quinone reductase [Bradyrhizobium elkanii]MCP1971034.1 NADPH2:quinone reductase [Bradyrhizobium elkanii]MCS4107459.1 NADPH2:quinone reductase [Bradyrhizobium elkanii]ODM72319.1 hypothetical protein A6452_04210 [Bradyrhizobium elkanii]ODM73742.1 hypothetical protein A6X20_36575 [Bradyrhizobium elkanii]